MCVLVMLVVKTAGTGPPHLGCHYSPIQIVPFNPVNQNGHSSHRRPMAAVARIWQAKESVAVFAATDHSPISRGARLTTSAGAGCLRQGDAFANDAEPSNLYGTAPLPDALLAFASE